MNFVNYLIGIVMGGFFAFYLSFNLMSKEAKAWETQTNCMNDILKNTGQVASYEQAAECYIKAIRGSLL